MGVTLLDVYLLGVTLGNVTLFGITPWDVYLLGITQGGVTLLDVTPCNIFLLCITLWNVALLDITLWNVVLLVVTLLHTGGCRAATFPAVTGIPAWRKIRKAFSRLAKFANFFFWLDKILTRVGLAW